MSSNQILKNPPIKEAIIYIGFSSPSNANSMDTISEFGDSLQDLFPNKNEQITFSLNFERNTTREIDKKSLITGFELTSSDKKETIVCTRNNLTFSKIKPYRNWEEFIEKFKVVFSKLIKRVADIKIDNLSLRYVNRLDFDVSSKIKLEDFFSVFPNVPSALSDSLEKYFLQIQLPADKSNLKSVLTQTFTYCENSRDLVHFHLDINIQKDLHLDNSDLWESLEDMRKKKNDLFFNSLTERTVQKYKE